MTVLIANLEKMLGGPRDGALLRYSLGNEWMKTGDPAMAASYFRQAVERDARYSAAWKMLGKALADSGQRQAAVDAYEHGLAIAKEKGDLQAAREMTVFAQRLRKHLAESNSKPSA